jgi:hypothetical protein
MGLRELLERSEPTSDAREEAFEDLKRARIVLHKLQRAQSNAGIRAELFGPGVVDKFRAAVGLG